MNDKVNEIIINYINEYLSNKDNINFEEFLNRLIIDIVNEMKLNDYINEIKILEVYEENPSSKGAYDQNKNLSIFKRGIEDVVDETFNETTYLNQYEKEICRLLLYIKTILHELEHVKQTMLVDIDKEENDFETSLTLATQDGGNNNSFGYACLYDIYPTERLAELNAYRRISFIVESLKEKYDIEKLFYYIKSKALLEEFYDYYQCGLEGPTKYYYDFVDKDAYLRLKERAGKKELSLYDKTLYGFEITEEEYKSLVMDYAYYFEETKKFGQGLN